MKPAAATREPVYARPMSSRLLRLLRPLTDEPTAADQPPPCRLRAVDEGAAELLTPEGTMLVLLELPAGDRAAALTDLEGRVRDLLRRVKQGVLHVAVIGGGAEVATLLVRLVPFWQLSARFHFHHLDDQGAYQRIKSGPQLAPLFAAAQRLAATTVEELPPLEAQEVADRIGAAEASTLEERRFSAAFTALRPVATWVLAGVIGVWFLVKLYFGGGTAAPALGRLGALHGPSVRAGELFRLLSAAFLHADAMHFAFNTMALLSFAPLLEGVLGSRRFLVLYLLTALAGNLVSTLVHPTGSAVGASGAIWGLMGGSLGLTLRRGTLLPEAVRTRLRKGLITPLVINLAYSFQGGIDLANHLGGGVVGLLLVGSGLLTWGARPVAEADRGRAEPKLVTALGLASALLLAAAPITALAVGQPWVTRRPPPLASRGLGATGLSISVPGSLECWVEPGHPELTNCGRLERDPIGIEIVVPPVAGPTPTLEDLHREFEGVTVEHATRQGPIQVAPVADRPTMTVEWLYQSKLRRRDRVFLLGPQIVVVRFYYLPTAPAAWCDLEPAILASVAAAGTPAP